MQHYHSWKGEGPSQRGAPVRKMNEMEIIERTLREEICPQLFGHGGGIETVSYEDGVYRFRALGQCSGCPTAKLHTEALVKEALSAVLPGLRAVELDDGISRSMLDQAFAILRRAEGRERSS